MAQNRTGSRVMGAVLVVVVAAAGFGLTACTSSRGSTDTATFTRSVSTARTSGSTTTVSSARTSASTTARATTTPATTPPAPPPTAAVDDGSIAVSALPVEAQETLRLIAAGGPYPYRRDGTEFRNRERLLPTHGDGWYHEYTVPTPGSHDRGARRIVMGNDGQRWYTSDHYGSFRRIREG